MNVQSLIAMLDTRWLSQDEDPLPSEDAEDCLLYLFGFTDGIATALSYTLSQEDIQALHAHLHMLVSGETRNQNEQHMMEDDMYGMRDSPC